jgi:DNA-binding MarR family transcriptional regulator
MTLFDILERLTRLHTNAMYHHPRLKGMPSVWVQILCYLARCNGYSNTPIATAEYLGLTKGTVSQSLNKLVSEGWLIKENDVRDKRVVHLILTAHAKTAIGEALQESRVDMPDLPPFSEGELQVVFSSWLRQLQKEQGIRMFGECRFCRFHQHRNGRAWCGLTQEPLAAESIELICREFEEPEKYRD